MNLFPLIESDCEIFSVKDFQESLECGIITDDDGSAYWAENQYYDADSPVSFPLDEAEKPKWATQIAWFNK